MGGNGGRDEAWHDALHRRFWPDVVRMLGRALGGNEGEAEDLAQQTFMTAWDRRTHVPDEPRAWLFATANNHLRNHRRWSRRHPLALIEMDVMEVVAGATEGEESTVVCDRLDLGRVWGQLKPAEQEVLRLAYLDGLDTAEIAHVLGLWQATVRKRRSRALGKLRGWMVAGTGDPVLSGAGRRGTGESGNG